MTGVWNWALAVGGLALLTSTAAGAEPAATGPRIPGFERFFANGEADAAAGGRLLISELNCRSCHPAENHAGPVGDKQAPILDKVGDRARPEWIQAFLTDPQQAKPGTTMPDVFSGLTEDVKRQQITALTHFLVGTGSISDTHPDAASAKRGLSHFRRVGCAACHDSPADGATPLATSVPFPVLGQKYSIQSLATFLKDPLAVRPSGRMPALGLKDEEYRDLANYFLRDREVAANVEFTTYQGSWEKLPDFESVKPDKKGTSAGFDLSAAGRENNFGIRFSTHLFIKAAGEYQLILGSDDGSRLLIDGEAAVSVDGIHPHEEKRSSRRLEAGWHPVVVEYFQGGGEWSLSVEIEGNGLVRQPLAGLVALSTETPLAEQSKDHFAVDEELARQGQTLFGSLGCANCHQLKRDDKPIAAAKSAKPWKELTGTGGCLSATPAVGVPNYRFAPRQVAAIAAAQSSAPADTTPQDAVHTTMAALNCYACHRRGEVGGVEEARNASFTSTQPEMGDEGRLPPALTGVGDKLRDDWLKQVLEQGANDRQNYMQTKMPKFGGRNVGHLAAAYIAIDRQPDSAPKPEFTEPDYRIKADGRHLVGAKALSCIKCHDFAQHPAQGIRAINLATMTKRLREDWFYRYMDNPTEYRPGTRMPAPWPFGQTTVRDVLGASVPKQMGAVWRYLSDGNKAAVPVGLVREPIELTANDAPILYRNFIDGAGSRAIGVGYPEKLNLAWDANDMRLAMVWHGAFIDASRHWNGRGVGFEAPLGDHLLPLPEGQPLAPLVSLNDAWPSGMARENGFRFRGYQLDEHERPTFKYTLGELTIDDFCQPVVVEGSKDPHLRRTLTITGPASDKAWYFRAVTAKSIVPATTPGGWTVDDTWTLTVDPANVGEFRDIGGRKELLLPIKKSAEKLTIDLNYAW